MQSFTGRGYRPSRALTSQCEPTYATDVIECNISATFTRSVIAYAVEDC
jgi:hypothetical protein